MSAARRPTTAHAPNRRPPARQAPDGARPHGAAPPGDSPPPADTPRTQAGATAPNRLDNPTLLHTDDEQARRSRLLLRDEWSGLQPPR
jgi:hypothetical protein